MRFGTIMADPPWQYPGGGPVGNGGRGSRGASNVMQVDVRPHYSTMTVDEIAALPVRDVAAVNAHVYLWITNPMLAEGLHVPILAAWGFGPVTVITWAKCQKGAPGVPSMKTGHLFRSASEHIVIGRRGHVPRADKVARPTWYPVERAGLSHSEKPDHFYEVAEAVSPGPRLELFGRRARHGWTVLGNQAPGDGADISESLRRMASDVTP